MSDEAELESFVASSFRSVWAIEVLTYLAEHAGTAFSAEELIARLRVSDAVISQSIDNLSAAGLALVGSGGRVEIYQANDEQLELVRAAIDFYRKSPNKVRRLIVAQASPGVTAFADAFKLRRKD
jgi:DNA-binding MarR family transcriptional regulator